jgi:hypothetical protein
VSESPERQGSADNDRCVLNSWHEWDVSGADRRIILCVETSLELRPGYPGFDPAALEVLIRDGNDMVRTSASPVDGLRIVPARWTV